MFEPTYDERMQTGWALIHGKTTVRTSEAERFSDNGAATEKMLNALDGIDPMEERYRAFERKRRAAMKSLTPRQKDFVRLKLRGWSDIEIARKWGVSHQALVFVRKETFKKMKKLLN